MAPSSYDREWLKPGARVGAKQEFQPKTRSRAQEQEFQSKTRSRSFSLKPGAGVSALNQEHENFSLKPEAGVGVSKTRSTLVAIAATENIKR